ncbi:MAG: hypothetical protein HY717_03715 [Planctomycetes bacterium]|nr:hypothetical protein [Planctomycetota bacterium]
MEREKLKRVGRLALACLVNAALAQTAFQLGLLMLDLYLGDSWRLAELWRGSWVFNLLAAVLLAPLWLKIIRSYQAYTSPEKARSFNAISGVAYLGAVLLLQVWLKFVLMFGPATGSVLIPLIGILIAAQLIGMASPIILPIGLLVGIIDDRIVRQWALRDRRWRADHRFLKKPPT